MSAPYEDPATKRRLEGVLGNFKDTVKYFGKITVTEESRGSMDDILQTGSPVERCSLFPSVEIPLTLQMDLVSINDKIVSVALNKHVSLRYDIKSRKLFSISLVGKPLVWLINNGTLLGPGMSQTQCLLLGDKMYIYCFSCWLSIQIESGCAKTIRLHLTGANP